MFAEFGFWVSVAAWAFVTVTDTLHPSRIGMWIAGLATAFYVLGEVVK